MKTHLGKHIKLYGGGTPSKEIDAYWDGNIPWASVKDLKEDRLICPKDNISEEGVRNSATRVVPKGSLIIATRMAVGKVAFASVNMAINQDLKVIENQDDIDRKFLYYLLKSKESYFQIVSSGATVKGIKIEHINRLEFNLPPLATQKKIAAIMDAADAHRQKTKQLLAKYDQLAQSIFLEMFGDTVTNPKGWEIKEGLEVCEKISVGVVIQPASYYKDHGVIALRSLNVKPFKIDLKDLVYFDEESHLSLLKKSILRKGDVVVVRTGNTGTAAVIPEELDGVNCIDLIIIRVDLDYILPTYLCYFLNSDRGKHLISGKSVGGIQKHFNVGAMKKIRIPIPPIVVQKEFIERITLVNSQKEKLEMSLINSENLFNGLLQKAFNGELVK